MLVRRLRARLLFIIKGNIMEKLEGMSVTAILERIRDIDVELMSMSYSQSDPGAMMDRRMMRKEKDKLEQHLSNKLLKCNPPNKQDSLKEQLAKLITKKKD